MLSLRDGAILRNTFSLVPPYLRTEEGKGFGGLPWLSEYGFQQTRGFRALKLWMTLLHQGRKGVTETVSRHRALARHMASIVETCVDLELLAPVELSIVCFRFAPAELSGKEDELNRINKRVMEMVQAGGDAFLSSAMINGRFALRACVLHYATTPEDVAALISAVRRTGESMMRGR